MADVQLFKFDGLFAESTPEPRPRSTKPNKYEFGIAYGVPETIPLDGLREAISKGLKEDGRGLAKYPHPQGYPPLRELIAQRLLATRNVRVSPDDILLGDGSGQTIHLICEALFDPGDVVLTESFTFNGTLNSMRRFRADTRGVPCDDDGMFPEALEQSVKDSIAQGKKPKFIYVVPTFQNPLEREMTLGRRQDVLRIAQQYDLPIFEDDCYVDLRFEGESVTSIHSLDDTGRVLYTASFSKNIAPGIRIGYVTAPPVVMERLKVIRGGWVNEFAAMAVYQYSKDNLDDHIEELTDVLRGKRDAMLAALGESFGSAATWTVPSGGMYVWVTMPEGTDASAALSVALDAGVAYQPGHIFAPDGVSGKNCFRLTFGYNSLEEIHDGIGLLAEVFTREGVFAS